jgi:hypothetical protein
VRDALHTSYSPSFRLVLAHFAAGVIGMIVFAGLLIASAAELRGPFFQAHMLGLVHLCVLGWLLPITLGALHQLVPVVFGAPLASERVAWAGLALYVPGAAGLVVGFWRFDVYRAGFVGFAALLLVALLVEVGHLTVTIVRSRVRSLTGTYMAAAFVWLVFAVGLGFALAWNLHRPYLTRDHLQLLRAHAHAAGFGFFGLLVMGVAFRLLEMFLIARVARQAWGVVALVAANLALVLLVVGFVTGRAPLGALGAAAAALAVVAFLVQVRLIVRARTRRRLDVAFGHTATAFAYLGFAAALGVLLWLAPLPAATRERVSLAYGLVALPGFVGTVIVGQMHKILPFLVWFHRFSPFVGLKKLPAASDLLPVRPQRLQWLAMHLGLAALAAGLLLDRVPLRVGGAAAFGAAALLFARNLLVIVRSQP